MFGHNDDDQNGAAGVTDPVIDPTASATDDASPDAITPVAAYDTTVTDPTTAISLPAADAAAPPAAEEAAVTPVVDTSGSTPTLPAESPSATAVSSTSTTAVPDDLLTMKQEALQQLQPLVSHLEQTPEEEFRTIMMMIQASDDHTMIQKAYAAAQKIPDDKIRAQALLDVINEINYFTQQKQA